MTNRGCYPKKFILKGTPEELEGLTAKKLALIAAHCTSVPFACETATHEECKTISTLAKPLVLLVVFHDPGIGRDEIITVATSRSMMKIIAAASSEDSILMPQTIPSSDNILNEAKIDGWLSFVWYSLDVPLQAASPSLEDETSSEAEKEGIEEDLKNALKKIEEHLSKQNSCLLDSEDDCKLRIAPVPCGDSSRKSYSLADLSLAITLHFMMEKGIAVSAMSSEENPHLTSWKKNIHTALGLAL